MNYYIIFTLMVLSIGYIYFFNRRHDAAIFKFWIFVLFFLSAFRYETGNDWYTYQRIFDLSLDIQYLFLDFKYYINNLYDIEIGYRILNSIVKSFGGNLQTIFIITGILSFWSLKNFINKYSNHKSLSLLIYYSIFFFNFNMSIIRQGIALSLFFIAFDYLIKRNFLKFITLIIIASFFHTSSLVLLPVYFIYNLKYSRTIYSILIAVALIIRLGNVKLLQYIANLLPEFIRSDIIVHLSPDNYMHLLTFGNVERFIMFILIVSFGKILISKNKDAKMFIHLYIIYILINLVLFENEIIVTRIRFYFQVSYFILLPIFIDSIKENSFKAITLICIYLFSIIPIYNFLSNEINNSLYNPYQNIIVHKYILDIESNGYERFENIINNIKR